MSFINFFPGDSQGPRVLDSSATPTFETAEDVNTFVQSVMERRASSIQQGDIQGIVNDESKLKNLQSELGYDQAELDDLAQEVRAAAGG